MPAPMRPNPNTLAANGSGNPAWVHWKTAPGKPVALAEPEGLPPAQVPQEEVDLWAEESPFEEVRRSHRNLTKYWIAAAIVATAIAASSIATWKALSGLVAPGYDVTAVQRKDIAKTISATGKAQAQSSRSQLSQSQAEWQQSQASVEVPWWMRCTDG